MIINVKTNSSSYDVIIQKNILENVENYIDINKKILIVTDDGIPEIYIDLIVNKINNPLIFKIKQGEKSKNLDNTMQIIDILMENDFSRNDIVIALGGGVVGDLAGFASSIYKRGLNFINIPTTLLAQVDSSIGGKTAIDHNNVKNIIGSFYPPKKVLIDPNTLKTLDKRQLHAGLVESIKMAMTFDERLFELIEQSLNIFNDIENIIYQSLLIKKDVVEKDEKESGLRKVLNFGHSIGHGLESYFDMKYLHGECVGLGMLYMVDESLKERLIKLLKKYDLPIKIEYDKDEVFKYILKDKKADSEYIDIIKVDKLATYKIEKILISKIKDYL